MRANQRTEGEPHDRRTRLCDAMIAALEAHPEYAGEERVAIFIRDGRFGGLVLHGYDDDTDAVADILGHLKAIMEANGKTLMVIPVGEG